MEDHIFEAVFIDIYHMAHAMLLSGPLRSEFNRAWIDRQGIEILSGEDCHSN